MNWLYLGILLLSIAGVVAADWRYKLAFFVNKRATILTIATSVLFFLAWDVLGVQLKIFFVGDSKYLSGLRVLPEVPIEEIFFLILLCYTVLITWRRLKV